jgi:hypothetical protein
MRILLSPKGIFDEKSLGTAIVLYVDPSIAEQPDRHAMNSIARTNLIVDSINVQPRPHAHDPLQAHMQLVLLFGKTHRLTSTTKQTRRTRRRDGSGLLLRGKPPRQTEVRNQRNHTPLQPAALTRRLKLHR